MRIRGEQMAALSSGMREQFVLRMLNHLRSRFPAVPELKEPQAQTLIQSRIDRAARYGVEDADDVRRFLECCARFGWDFDTDERTAWAGTILKASGRDGTLKMDRIDDHELFVLKGLIGERP